VAIADRAMSILDEDLRGITARFLSDHCPGTTSGFPTQPSEDT
jgi:hypothetical protein